MNDLTADTGGIQSHGGDVNSIGRQIGTDISSRRESLDATTEGLKTPGAFAGVVDTWSGICQGVSSEVCRAGDGTIAAGGDHEANEGEQEAGMRGRNPGG